MKKLLTGYYSASKRYPKEATQVRISSSAPFWWTAEKKMYFPRLVWRQFKAWRKGLWTGDYRLDYRAQLEEMRQSGELQKIIASIPEGSILLCYESDVKTCHRSWLSEFLTEHKLAEITEHPVEACAKKSGKSCHQCAGQTSFLS